NPDWLRSQCLELALLGQTAQCPAFQLADALGREADQLGHLAQRERLATADAEAELDDPPRVRIQALEGLPDRRLLELDGHLLEGRRPLERDERAELRVALRADRRLEADGHALGGAELVELMRVHPELLRLLLVGGLAAEL